MSNLFSDRLRRKLSRLRFNNKRFWNNRYQHNIAMGSGPGSRGDILIQKREIISKYMQDYSLKSVVDLGCGDIEIIKTLDIDTYTGIDFSEIVIERNKKIRPDWHFQCGDITALKINQGPDLVLCLDVLIHQKKRSDYEAILRAISKLQGRVIILSGYARDPDGWNVYFHEPLGVTLAALMPGRTFHKVAEYRDTDLCVSVSEA